MKSDESHRWTVNAVMAALRNAPAPLRNEAEAEAFDEAVSALLDFNRRSQRRTIALAASAELIRVVDATIASKGGKKLADEVMFALKALAYLGTKEGVACIIRAARGGFASDSFLWSIVLEPFGEGHVGAEVLFGALSKRLPDKFLAICLLDAANGAAREHDLKKHPFDSAKGAQRLAGYLSLPKPEEDSYAVSACAALPYLRSSRRKPLVVLARKHKSAEVRMEVAWATAKTGDQSGIDYLVEKCLDRNHSMQARQYLKELGMRKLVPRAARDPDFAAMAEMCQWLSHPNEYGEPPDTIELMDKRTIYWPPMRKTRELRLFKFFYKKDRYRDVDGEGVGMVGSITWAFFDDVKPSMKPEQIYGHHCCFELEANDDPRAPKKRSGKAGWAMIKAGK